MRKFLNAQQYAFDTGGPGWMSLALIVANVVALVAGRTSVAVLLSVAGVAWIVGFSRGERYAARLSVRWQLEALRDQLDALDESELAPDHPQRAELATARAFVRDELERVS